MSDHDDEQEFEFQITAPATMTATVRVKAKSIEDAQEIALTPSWYRNPENAQFELDEGNILRDVYLPDEDDWEVVGKDEISGPTL